MIFNSLEYVIFLPVVVWLHFSLPQNQRWILLLVASYIFYAAWNVGYVALIFGSTVIDYFAAIRIHESTDKRTRRLWLVASLTGNLGMLFFFKYFNFASRSVFSVAHLLGVEGEPLILKVLLPVGISFYTFQSLSYTVDIYRNLRDPERHFGIFALYVSFFPQLVAGPIERSTHLLPQFHERHEPTYNNIREGMLLIALGFLKKCVIADRVAPYVDGFYAAPDAFGPGVAIVAAYLFTFQVYCDFSAYSDIAIGSGRLMGYDLMTNFRQPFCSRSVSEFWRRWHISLNTWFRDYVYMPLGGSHKGSFRTQLNIFIIFMVSGVWHGAAWTFVIWGAIHALVIIGERLTAERRERIRERLIPGKRAYFWVPVQLLIVFHVFGVSLVFFRANRLEDVWLIYGKLTSAVASGNLNVIQALDIGPMPGDEVKAALIFIVFMLVCEGVHQFYPFKERIFALPTSARWALYTGIFIVIAMFGNFQSHQFVYFQF